MLYIITVVLGLVLCVQLWRRNNKPSLPPGPRPFPIVGNVDHLPPGNAPEYEHWLKFKDQYGPISSVTMLGQPIILLHDRDAVRDLLVKSSKVTSSRPSFAFADMCGFGALLNLLSFNSTYLQHRKMIHKYFGTKTAAEQFKEAELVESHRLLLKTLDDPNGLLDHVKAEASAIILRITYGYEIAPDGPDPLVSLIEETMDIFVVASDLLLWPVNSLPFLRHLPSWLPGASFKRTARKWGKQLDTTLRTPFEFVCQEMAKGTHRPSYVSSLIEQETDGATDTIQKTAVVMYGGGSDTTVASLHAFILAMLLYPSVMRKAQAELDRVVGSSRLPHFDDRPNLPYINALVLEVFRWHPVAPLAIPHKTDEEIFYKGFRIPKSSYLISSLFWLLHDPSVYSSPSTFDPDRFLPPRCEPDPQDTHFGFGRRVCPGRYLADQTVFVTVARMLAVFNFSRKRDEYGNEIVPEKVGTPGLIMRVREFPYEVRPRGERQVELIRKLGEEVLMM